MHIEAVWFNSYLKAGGEQLILIGINTSLFSNDGVPVWRSHGSVFNESFLLVYDAALLVYLFPKFQARTCLPNPYPSDVASYTRKKVVIKMPLPFPGITLNSYFILAVFAVFGAGLRSWLRHCAISGFDSRFFIDNPTGRTLALGSIQPFNRSEY
jgi:hypothetical protein